MDQDEIYLQHIFDSICLIEKFVNNLDNESFLHDEKTQSAVTRQFEIIGEAVKNISKELKLQAPEIPWKKAADLRNSLIHEYFEVDLSALWVAIKRDIPDLKAQIKKLMKKDEAKMRACGNGF